MGIGEKGESLERRQWLDRFVYRRFLGEEVAQKRLIHLQNSIHDYCRPRCLREKLADLGGLPERSQRKELEDVLPDLAGLQNIDCGGPGVRYRLRGLHRGGRGAHDAWVLRAG